MTDTEADGTINFIFEAGLLKRVKRSGWWIAGIQDPESIAEHSFRTAIIGTVLAGMEGADPARVALLCLLHDIQETRIGDIPHNARRYLTATGNETITADQVSGCPPTVAETVMSAVAEYDTGETLESAVARDADKLECLIQAIEYRHQGTDTVQPWIDNSRAALRTAAAHRLTEAALAGDPLSWLTTFRSPQ